MILAVIPARGGSKRIPDKNIRPFCGRPMIEYSIEAAQQAGVFDRVIVSTDSEKIADAAIRCGAEVPFVRPPELADEFATTTPVVQHAIAQLTSTADPVGYACCIYATAPFVSPEDIRRGLETLKRTPAADFALPVTTFPYSIFRSLALQQNGLHAMLYPEHQATRSQDLPEAWHDAGQFYWAAEPTWRRLAGGILSASLVGIPIPRHRVQDIDTAEDWRRAELMFELLAQESHGPPSTDH
ncbi:CMP-N,N'-diacetyllegionaminic acid synthase [Rosistilla oblonga]|uniref:pseudaminic acid cytidylyltransferase n=1 Tax=Rosistilla oblonga TaxID=2527990 RepID=UPI00118BABB3|nr:pseudaminic acid cytidylyltransferase [Rosistilla oblonga]QDV11927.1 CMP-N,N'-diacetyllegionaminic acid synthase [Rosistilla oblonga]